MLSVLNMHPTHVVISSNKVHTERTFRTAATDKSGGARVALWRLASSRTKSGAEARLACNDYVFF